MHFFYRLSTERVGEVSSKGALLAAAPKALFQSPALLLQVLKDILQILRLLGTARGLIVINRGGAGGKGDVGIGSARQCSLAFWCPKRAQRAGSGYAR